MSPPEMEIDAWYGVFQKEWIQGQHVALIGATGTGKTTIAHTILDVRDFVCVLAVKNQDDTLERFQKGDKYGRASYHVIEKWPPLHTYSKVIFWAKPNSINDAGEKQATKLYVALNSMYLSGGWCIYFDEAGYIAGNLGLGRALGVLLNQGRSANISVVACMTRPRSMIARVPVETINQCRHVIIFKYADERETKACAEIVGISPRIMQEYQSLLQWNGEKKYSDFLHFYEGNVRLVRNSGG